MPCEMIHAPIPDPPKPALAEMPQEVRDAWSVIATWMGTVYAVETKCPDCGESFAHHPSMYGAVMSPTSGDKLAVGFRGLAGLDGTTYIGLR